MPRGGDIDMEQEQKYDGSMQRDKDDMKMQQQQSKHERRPSREMELRDTFLHTDFSEKAGTPAQRLEIMSKAVNDLTREREQIAAAKQKEEDAGFWEAERAKANTSGPMEKDTKIKPADSKPGDAGLDTGISSKPADTESKPAQTLVATKTQPEQPKPVQSKPALQRTHDDDDHMSAELPSERSSKLDRAAAKLPSQQRQEIDLKAGREIEEKQRSDKAALPDGARAITWTPAGEEVHLNETLAERKRWHAEMGREKHDPDNHKAGGRPTFREEIRHEISRIWPSKEQREHSVPTATHVPSRLQLHSHDLPSPELHSRNLERGNLLRGSDLASASDISAPVSIEQDLFKIDNGLPDVGAKLSDAKSSISHKLSDAKAAVSDKLEAAEDKLSQWKDEAAAKLEEAKHKAVELKDDAVAKGSELRDDAREKAAEIKKDVRDKKAEISRDIDLKKERLERDIDSTRADLRTRREEIDRDLRVRGAELKGDLRDARVDVERRVDSTSTSLRHKAHVVKEDLKAEVSEDIGLVKKKLHDIGDAITHKKDDLKDSVHHKKEDLKDSMAQKKEDIRERVDRDTADLSNRRIRSTAVEGEPTMFQRLTSWWPASSWRKGEVRDENAPTTLVAGTSGTMFPTHRWSRDPDAKDMQAKLDELRGLESGFSRTGGSNVDMRKHDPTFAGGIRSQLSNGWQHLKSDLKSGEHDWEREADSASAQDMDNAPTSPRSWEVTLPARSLPHPSSFSPSLSDVSPSRDVIPHEHRYSPRLTQRSIQSPVVVRTGGFFEAFDPTIMDAAVEPW